MGINRGFFPQRRGQVTVFLIIGVVLLLSLIVFLFLRSESSGFGDDTLIQLSDNSDVAQVQTYITECLDLLSEDALLLVGQQGGYTDLASVGAVTSYLDPTEADGFVFAANSQVQIPYWHYLLSRNDCSGDCLFFSQRPLLEGESARTIEQQLKTYINRNFASCLDNFDSFTSQGYEINQTRNVDEYTLDPIDTLLYPFETEILFRDNDVKFTLEYPILISKGIATESVTTYSTEHDVPLKRMYFLASTLAAVEQEYRYLETQTVELISLNSGIDKKKLPPLGGATNEFSSNIFWLVPQVEEKVQELLSVYTNAFRVLGTANYRDIVFPESSSKAALDRVFANMVIPLNDEDDLFIDLDVNYDYFNWPWYFHINSDGVIIKPDSLSIAIFPFFGVQRFRHYYDISNPVRVAVSKPDARDGAGYTFAFGLENNVRNNEPLRENYEDYVKPYINTTFENEQNTPGLVQETLVCNFDQRNTNEIEITVLDKHSGSPISDASVSFTCAEETCALGMTDANGVYKSKLPVCGGAFISAIKTDTVRGVKHISTSLDFSEDQTLELERIVEKKISARKLLITKMYPRQFSKWSFVRYADLDVSELVTISFQRVEDNPVSERYSTVTSLDGGAGPDTEFTVDLVPGYYEVAINSMIQESLLIPESHRKADDERYTIDEIFMEDSFPAGRVELNGQTRLWHVTADDIYDENEIVFYYPYSDLINVPEELRVVEDLKKPQDIARKLIQNNISLFIPSIIK